MFAMKEIHPEQADQAGSGYEMSCEMTCGDDPASQAIGGEADSRNCNFWLPTSWCGGN